MSSYYSDSEVSTDVEKAAPATLSRHHVSELKWKEVPFFRVAGFLLGLDGLYFTVIAIFVGVVPFRFFSLLSDQNLTISNETFNVQWATVKALYLTTTVTFSVTASSCILLWGFMQIGGGSLAYLRVFGNIFFIEQILVIVAWIVVLSLLKKQQSQIETLCSMTGDTAACITSFGQFFITIGVAGGIAIILLGITDWIFFKFISSTFASSRLKKPKSSGHSSEDDKLMEGSDGYPSKKPSKSYLGAGASDLTVGLSVGHSTKSKRSHSKPRHKHHNPKHSRSRHDSDSDSDKAHSLGHHSKHSRKPRSLRHKKHEKRYSSDDTSDENSEHKKRSRRKK